MKGLQHAVPLVVMVCLGTLPLQAHPDCPELAWFTEADVWPMYETGFAGGDGMVSFNDSYVVFQLVTGQRTPLNICEFTVADCAPRATHGNGYLTAADATQAFRYSTGRDDRQFSGEELTNAIPTVPIPGAGPRALKLGGGPIVQRVPNDLVITMDGAGDEFALGFTLEFNADELAFVKVSPGSTNMTVVINDTQAASGRLGFLFISYPNFPATVGTELVRFTFQGLDIGVSDSTVRFSDALATREIVNFNADPLECVFRPASFPVVVRQPSLQGLASTNQTVSFQLKGEVGGHYLVESSTNLVDWQPLFSFTNSSPTHAFSEPFNPEQSRKFYRAELLPW